MRRRATIAGTVLVTLAAAGIATRVDPSPAPARPVVGHGADAALGLPAPSAGGLRVARTAPIDASTGRSSWIAVRSGTTARAAPRPGARGVGRGAGRTPENTTNIVQPIGRRRDARGRLWIRVRLAALPNGRTGWVPRSALGGYGEAVTHLVVDRRALTATLLRDGRRVLRVPVAIGTPSAPTPAGTFVVRNVLRRYTSRFYGPVAFGTSARSATLTDWPGGGYVGIHGTDRPDLVPGRVSHGCIRMRNDDILRLARLMAPGTPLTIV
jgi:lipoprotein-anchoring transpeptidase ErfK/SrfK